MPPVRTAAHVLFVNATSQVLLRLRNDRPGEPSANQWELFGGAVEGNETLRETAIREVNEEIGLYITDLEYLGEYPTDVVNNVFLSFFPVRLQAIALTKGQRLQYVSADEARTLDVVPWVSTLLDDFFGEN
jgi:8-oxo-dGTP pyrophosphatase MutT (NUDIX family)